MDKGEMHERLVRENGPALTVAKIAEPVLGDLGFRLVRVRISGQGNSELQVMAEREDGTLTIEDCVAITRALSPVLDVEDPIAGKYRLEISSPGIDRPLVRPCDFENNAGDVAKIELREALAGRRRFKGRLEGFEDGEVRIYVKPDDGSDDDVLIGLPFRQIHDAKLVMTDELFEKSRKAAKSGAPSDGSELD
ncbi:MAG TPA: ribosome maturation factor RimP [Rhizobiales bacterium]|nr:ribosome maturation factor RimP [Hyphomicrobiales bacterium]